jgi:hypothetical protein
MNEWKIVEHPLKYYSGKKDEILPFWQPGTVIHGVTWNKPGTENKYHLSSVMKSKNVDHIEVEGRIETTGRQDW